MLRAFGQAFKPPLAVKSARNFDFYIRQFMLIQQILIYNSIHWNLE